MSDERRWTPILIFLELFELAEEMLPFSVHHIGENPRASEAGRFNFKQTLSLSKSSSCVRFDTPTQVYVGVGAEKGPRIKSRSKLGTCCSVDTGLMDCELYLGRSVLLQSFNRTFVERIFVYWLHVPHIR